MIGLMQVGIQAMADRYAYLSFIGLFIMVCWGIAEWARQRHISSAKLAAVSVIALLALAVMTRRQISYWDDNVTLWSHAVAVTRNNYMAEDHLGGALLADGQLDAAMPHFYRAVAINPDDPDSNLNIGGYEQQQRNFPQAIAQYNKVISATQDSAVLNAGVRAKAFDNMGYVYRAVGRFTSRPGELCSRSGRGSPIRKSLDRLRAGRAKIRKYWPGDSGVFPGHEAATFGLGIFAARPRLGTKRRQQRSPVGHSASSEHDPQP